MVALGSTHDRTHSTHPPPFRNDILLFSSVLGDHEFSLCTSISAVVLPSQAAIASCILIH